MTKILFALLLAFSQLAYGQQTYREHLIVGAGARTTTGQSGSFESDLVKTNYVDHGGRVFVRVTAVSGTSPTMIATLQGEVDGNLYVIGQSVEITQVGTYSFAVDYIPSRVRGGWIIGGTSPSFNFNMWLVRR